MSLVRNTLLVASLAVNVFAIGYVAGDYQKGPPKHHMGLPGDPRGPGLDLASPRGAQRHLFAMVVGLKALPEERRAALRTALEGSLPQTRELAISASEAQRALADIFDQEPFDAAAAEVALGAAIEANVARQRFIASTLIALQDELTPEERVLVRARAEEMRKEIERRRRERRMGGARGDHGPRGDHGLRGDQGPRPFRDKMTGPERPETPAE